jgi:hypothetical protein
LALTSPTRGGRSVGIVRLRIKATEFSSVRIWGSQISGYEQFHLLGFNAMQSIEYQVKQVASNAACFVLFSCLAYSLNLKMEAICSSETSVHF